MAYEIIKNVPMPTTAKAKYDFEKMEVNDMMFVPIEDGEDSGTIQNRVSSAAASWGKRRDRTFATQVVKNKGVLGVGVWRVT